MKRVNFIKQSAADALFLAAISFAGCKKDNGDDDPKALAISMTTAMEGEVVIRLAGSGTTVINWGDGSALEKVTLLEYTLEANYSHPFLPTAQTIVTC